MPPPTTPTCVQRYEPMDDKKNVLLITGLGTSVDYAVDSSAVMAAAAAYDTAPDPSNHPGVVYVTKSGG